MNGVLVVPLNPKRLNVISTDTLFVGALRSVLCVILRMQQIVLILFKRQNFNLCIGNIVVIHKRQMK